MNEETRAALEAALLDGAINDGELLDLIARGYVRLKYSMIERAVAAGVTESDLEEVTAKRRNER